MHCMLGYTQSNVLQCVVSPIKTNQEGKYAQEHDIHILSEHIALLIFGVVEILCNDPNIRQPAAFLRQNITCAC